MALWQFDCYIIPGGKYVEENKIVAENIVSWKNKNVPMIQIDFLEKQPSWTESIVQYGKEDETCIQFFYEDGLLEEINCRFDLRSLSKIMLKNILEYVQEIKGMIFYEDNIYYPNVVEIVELMKKSNAGKFCKNPTRYFEKLSKESSLMQIEHINISKLADLLSNNEECYADDIVYCEIKYERDRSSYAGMAFKIIDKKNTLSIRKSREKIVREVSPYEKIIKGCEKKYVDSIKEIYLSEEREYGLDIYFLIYSDVRSSQIIFEELMKNVNEHIDEIRNT